MTGRPEAKARAGWAALDTLLVRRLAHDLATPLGALGIALEMGPEPDPVARAALGQAEARLALFRALFGAGPDEPFDLGLLAPAVAPHGVTAVPDGLLPPAVRGFAALALDTAALLSAPGRMVLGREQGPAGRPQLRLEGRVRPPGAALAAVLAGAPAEEPAAVGAAFAVALLGPLDVTPSSDGLVFRPRG